MMTAEQTDDLEEADVVLVGVSANLEDANLDLPRQSRGEDGQCAVGSGVPLPPQVERLKVIR